MNKNPHKEIAGRSDETIDNALVEIRNYLQEHYGINFEYEKLYSLEHKLTKRLRDLSLDDFSEYEEYLKNNSDEISKFLDEVSTNKTAFFREPKHWQFLIQEIIPEWRKRNDLIKTWTIPCSSGEEPYSLAMIAHDYLDNSFIENDPGQSMKILGSDISRNALQSARKGIYDKKRFQQVKDFNSKYAKKYFQGLEKNKYALTDQIKQKITLRTFNLNVDTYPFSNTFDLILCRNVLIYFDNNVINHVINQLTKCLKSNGYLFIGHTESLYDIDHDLYKIRPSIFQKRCNG